MEPNSAYAVPVPEDSKMKVYASMQWPTAVNKVVQSSVEASMKTLSDNLKAERSPAPLA